MRWTADATHLAIFDSFRPSLVRHSDGFLISDPGMDSPLLFGMRVAEEGRVMHPDGRWDLDRSTHVRDLGQDTPLRSIPWIETSPDTYGVVTSALGRASTFLLESTRQPEPHRWMRRVNIATGEENRVALTPLDEALGEPSLLLDEATQTVFILSTGRGWHRETEAFVERVVFPSLEYSRVAVPLAETRAVLGVAHVGEPQQSTIDGVLSHDGRTLLITTRDGLLRTFDAITLEEMDAPLDVGIAVANPDTYLPSLQSPVAFSSGDHWLAYVDVEGHVVIVDSETRTFATRLNSRLPMRPWADPHDAHTEASVAAIRFVDDGLVVLSDLGTERFQCPSSP